MHDYDITAHTLAREPLYQVSIPHDDIEIAKITTLGVTYRFTPWIIRAMTRLDPDYRDVFQKRPRFNLTVRELSLYMRVKGYKEQFRIDISSGAELADILNDMGYEDFIIAGITKPIIMMRDSHPITMLALEYRVERLETIC